MISLLSLYTPTRYLMVSLATVVFYDYALNFDQEVQLIWGCRRSRWTYSYVYLRYGGLLETIFSLFYYLPISLSDRACFVFYVLMELVMPATLVAVLQGVMTARVCALYKNSKAVVIPLYGGLVLVQLLNIALTIAMSALPRGLPVQENVVLGTRGCFYGDPSIQILWSYVVSNGSICLYEFILIVLLVYRSVKWIKDHDNPYSASDIKEIIKLLARQGLLYFVWMVTYEVLSIRVASDDLTKSNALLTTLNGLTLALQTGLFCVLGPWLILSIQKHLRRADGGDGTGGDTSAVSTIVFETPAIKHATSRCLETSSFGYLE